MADVTAGRSSFAKLLRSPDLLVSVAVITILIMLVIPLPTIILDIFMTLSISISLLLMLLVLFSDNPLDLSIFPTMLLLLTLFRLALNVSSTRLILLQGPNFDGRLIKAFGEFVISGNYVVGLIIFIVLIAVQFIVISRGTTRVSEVAARFALDSLPGKQMAIDSDLAAGIVTEHEAVKRRLTLQREADFYGAMDGASKFVSGDVIVGIVITLVNAIGGIIIGALTFKMDFATSAQVFILLTVGDGLVSQIPSLLNAVAAGIIVTRSVANDTLGNEIKAEVTKQALPLWVVSATLLFFGILPGFPKIAFFSLSFLFGFMAYSMSKKDKKAKQEQIIAETEEEKPLIIDKLVPVEPIALELGYSLIPLVDKAQGGDLFDRISNVRKQIAFDYGMIVPPIMVRDSLRLESNEYCFKINGVKVASWILHPEKLLAINSGIVTDKVEGTSVNEPTYGLDAVWIDSDKKDKAESLGYTVIDSGTIIATHLTETIINNVDSLLGREEVKKILDSIRNEYQTLVSEVEKATNIGFLQKVFQNLLMEKISIRNITVILETIADTAKDSQNPEVVTENVRQKLKNQLCRQYADEAGKLSVYTLHPKLENYLADEFEKVERTGVTSLNPQYLNVLIQEMTKKLTDAQNKKLDNFIVLASTRIRRHVHNLFKTIIPRAIFISYDEISPHIHLEYVGEIDMPEK